jgi:hypothetical protein
MSRQTGITLKLAVIVLGFLSFMPGEVRAGAPGAQNGNKPNAQQYCLNETGDTTYYRNKPQDCRCTNPKTQDCTPRASIHRDRGDLGPLSAGTQSGGGGASEKMIRQAASALLSLLVLCGGLFGVAFSVSRLLFRHAPGGRPRLGLRGLMALPHPRAFGLAVFVAVIGIASGAVLSTRSTNASGAAARPAAARPAPVKSAAAVAAPAFSSALQVSGLSSVQIGGTAIDREGNTYVAGGFNGEVTFNTSPQPTKLVSGEGFDAFVAKYNAAGRVLWARMARGATGLTFTDPDTNESENFSFDGALALAVDSQGAAYVGGGFVKSLTFEDAAGDAVATLGDDTEAESDEINFELFVAKYDSTGTLLWAKGGESGALDDSEAEEDLDSGINGVTDIVIDRADHPYVAGTFSGTNFLGREVSGEGGRDVLLSRLNPATGEPVWVNTPGSANTDAAMGLAVDDFANVYLIGDMGGTITFPTVPRPTTLTLDDEFGDAFIAKYDSSGRPLFAKQVGGTQPIDGTHIAVNGAGEIYLTGAFAGEAEFDSIKVTDPSLGEGASGFLAKYTTDGHALWARVFGRADQEASEGDTLGYRVAVDGTGAPYVSGIFVGEATFGQESPADSQTLLSVEPEDKFLAHYDAAGNFLWVKQLAEGGGDLQGSFLNADIPVEVVPARLVYNAAAKALVLTGDFQGTLTLDAITLDSLDARHGYVATLPLPQAPASSSTVQFSPAQYTLGEGAGSIQVTVTRSGDVSGAASVDYAASDGTASQKSDYQLALGTLRFAPGDTSKTFRLSVVDDGFAEGAETVDLTLSGPAGTSLGANGTASVTINDNDTRNAASNPIDATAFFVRQHYLDFLGREPDTQGFNFWVRGIESCGADAGCREVRRINTSAAFFLSIEFQETGFYALRVQRVAFGKKSVEASSRVTYQHFIRDARRVGEGAVVGQAGWEQQLESNKGAYAELVVASPEFLTRFPASQTAVEYVSALYASAGVTSTEAERQAAVNAFGAGGNAGRAAALKSVTDSESVRRAEFIPAFVLMEYFSYLRRNPVDPPDADDSGYQFWLGKLNQFNGNFVRAEMVKAFLSSAEYRQRFGQQ